MSTSRQIQVALRALAGPGGPTNRSASERALAAMQAPTARRHAAATQALAGLAGYNSGGWVDSFADHMRRVPAEVLNEDLCNACVVRADGETRVFVGLGLLKAIVYFEEWIHVGTHAAETIEGRAWSDETTLQRILYGALIPLIAYVRDGRPLPRPGGALSVPGKALIYVNSAMAVQFLMMHELGHEACGHLRLDEAGSGCAPATLPAGAMETLHAQELEADRHVLGALRSDWLPMAAAYCLNLMMLIGMLERHLGPAGSHPLAVARMEQVIEALGDVCAPSITDNLAQLMRFHRDLWNAPEEPIVRLDPAVGDDMLALLQKAYKLHLVEQPDLDPTPREIEKAALWDQTVAALWSDASEDRSNAANAAC